VPLVAGAADLGLPEAHLGDAGQDTLALLGDPLGGRLGLGPRLAQGLGEVGADAAAVMLGVVAGNAPGFAEDGG
jgi:hypothetical protein